VYDRFRGRIMFPIADVHGKIVGFTGRILSNDKKEAKYVNTPETSLYRKSAVLYGLDRAKGEIRQKDQVVLVEGNMDVVGSHQFGVNNVVACSGTALTNEQLMLIKRFTNNIAIAFDQDAAGNAATLRGLDLARAQDFSITIITLPPEAGKDPDDAVRKDPEIWRQAIKDAVNSMEWIYRRAFKAHEIHTPEGKKLVARDLLPEIARMKDAVERDGWIKKLARDLVVGEGALLEAMKGIVPPRPSAPASSFAQVASPTSKPAPKRFFSTDEEREHQLLCLMMSRVELFAIAMDEIHWQAEEFASPLVAGLYKKLVFGYAEAKLNDGHPPADSSPEEISLYNALAFEAERDLGEETLESLTRDLAYLTDVLRAKRTTDARKILEQAMREAEQRGDIERIAELVKRFNALQ
jgi:DNA primase